MGGLKRRSLEFRRASSHHRLHRLPPARRGPFRRNQRGRSWREGGRRDRDPDPFRLPNQRADRAGPGPGHGRGDAVDAGARRGPRGGRARAGASAVGCDRARGDPAAASLGLVGRAERRRVRDASSVGRGGAPRRRRRGREAAGAGVSLPVRHRDGGRRPGLRGRHARPCSRTTPTPSKRTRAGGRSMSVTMR